MTHYIEAKIAISKQFQDSQIDAVFSAVHNYNARTESFKIGVTFFESTDFSDKSTLNKLAIVGNEIELNDFLANEGDKLSAQYMVVFSDAKELPVGLSQSVFSLKQGVGITRGILGQINKRAQSHVNHVKNKFGQDLDILKVKADMVSKSIALRNDMPVLSVSVYSSSSKKRISMKIVKKQIAVSTEIKRSSDRPFNIYGLKGSVPLLR